MEIGIILLLFVLPFILAYWVYGDAKKRGMNAELWAIAVFALIMMGFFPGFFLFLLYILIREDMTE